MIVTAVGAGEDCGPGTGWDLLLWQPLSINATATAAAAIGSAFMAVPSCHHAGQR